MSNFYWTTGSLVGIGMAVITSNFSLAQSQTIAMQSDPPNRVSIEYVSPGSPTFQELYDLLRDRHALEKIQEILSPLRLPVELIIKTTECSVVNSWYRRENFKPTVTICYEFLKHILDSLPNETTPDGVTPADAAVGQFVFVTLHEVGHAAFDIFNVPIFGHEENAADNFATYIMLQFGRGRARRLIGGAAWAWRAYLGDYKRNPMVRVRIASFAEIMVCPKSAFTIFCVSRSVPIRGNSPMRRVICRQHGRHAVGMNTKRWYVRFIGKSVRISIRNGKPGVRYKLA